MGMLRKSMNWFLYDNGFRRERVKGKLLTRPDDFFGNVFVILKSKLE